MRVTAAAPIRIDDCGGWTDTWFARRGRVVNIAVRPCAEVHVAVHRAADGRPAVVINADDFGDRYEPPARAGEWGKHPLIEAAIEQAAVGRDVAIEVTVACDVPAGSSTGTSAAVTVALLGALDRVCGVASPPREVARRAHEVETARLGRQSGIQDQICSALGGINDIEMTAYPQAVVRQIPMSPALRWELERRLLLVVLGRGHSSSDIHERVIERLASLGPECAELESLRHAAAEAGDALGRGDLAAFGAAMSANTEAQRGLHPDLVCLDAERVIAIAREHGAAGWKVNGAGGDGGSLTLLGPVSLGARRAMLRAIHAESHHFRCVPVALDGDGLRVWTSEP